MRTLLNIVSLLFMLLMSTLVGIIGLLGLIVTFPIWLLDFTIHKLSR